MRHMRMCPLCHSDRATIVATIADYTVPMTNVICLDCGLVYIHPQPTAEALHAYYAGEFIQGRHQVGSVEEARARARKKGSAKKYSIEGLRDGLSSSSRVLEIGCSYGFLLHALQEAAGCHVEGVEPSAVSGAFAREEFGFPVFTGTVEEYLASPKTLSFDLIIVYHVLEHLADPVAVLKSLRERLAPNGRLSICVPDVTHVQEPPESFFQVPHVMSFSPWTLQRVMADAGMKIISFQRKLRSPKNGMEAFAVAEGDVRTALPASSFRLGSPPSDVIRYLARIRMVYVVLRACKHGLLAVFPRERIENVSIRISQCMRRLTDRFLR